MLDVPLLEFDYLTNTNLSMFSFGLQVCSFFLLKQNQRSSFNIVIFKYFRKTFHIEMTAANISQLLYWSNLTNLHQVCCHTLQHTFQEPKSETHFYKQCR